jgi:tricorn protease
MNGVAPPPALSLSCCCPRVAARRPTSPEDLMVRVRIALIALILLVVPVVNAAAGQSSPAIRTAHFPSLSPDGKRICFSWHGDLWLVPSTGGAAARLAMLPGYDTRPKWSPDGQTIAFMSNRAGNNDIYTIPAAGGSPTQITFHSADDVLGDWSPDGKQIVFSSARESRSSLLYSVRLSDGRLRKLTDDEQALQAPAVSPDGKLVAYVRGSANPVRKGYHGSANGEIYLLPTADPKKAPRRLTNYNGNDLWPLFTADSKTIYYVTDRSGTANVWQMPVTGGPGRQITRYQAGAVRYPSISQDRKSMAFECDFGIWTLALNGKATPARVLVTAADDQPSPGPATRTFTSGASEYEVSPDGKQIALVLHGEIFTIPTETGGEARRITNCPARDSDVAWSPDAKKLAYVCEYGANQDVHVVNLETREDQRITTSTAPETSPVFSPDGKWLAFVRGPGSRWLCVVRAEGGTERVVAEGPFLGNLAWSPDSVWLAYTRRDLANTSDVWVSSLDGTGKALNVTRFPGTNTQPRWTADGRHLLFVSGRSGNSEVWRVDLVKPGTARPAGEAKGGPPAGEGKGAAIPATHVVIDPVGIAKRVRQLTNQPQATKGSFTITPDGKTCYFTLNVLGQTDLWSVPVDGGAPTKALPSVSGSIRLSADGNTVFYQSGGGGRFGGRGQRPTGGPSGGGSLYRIPRAGGTPTQINYTAKMEIDPVEERRQVFDEGWRLLRDGFYDERMHGADWNAVRERYRPAVDECVQREDFYQLMSEMIGELNASHLGVGGANAFARPTPGGPAMERGGMGFLGVWFDYDYPGPGLKVTDVMPDGPADSDVSRVRPGEYILALDGKDVTASELLFKLLAGKAGQSVELLVNGKPEKDGARTVKLTPIARGAWSELWYERWVAQNRRRVEQISGGRLAYMHIRAMDDASLKRFEKELLSEAYDKEGLVLDVRWNGGGRIHDELLAILSKKVHAYETPRGGLKMTQPFSAFTHPMILLINQSSASDAEIFPHGFRLDGLGKLVGVPTMGAVIGTSNRVLLDGTTTFRVPATGWTTPEGQSMENYGVPPDVLVENRPEDILAGRDRQLDTAAAELLKQSGARK